MPAFSLASWRPGHAVGRRTATREGIHSLVLQKPKTPYSIYRTLPHNALCGIRAKYRAQIFHFGTPTSSGHKVQPLQITRTAIQSTTRGSLAQQGVQVEPPLSLPTAPATSRPATPDAEPLEEPPAQCAMFHGLAAGPCGALARVPQAKA